MGIAAASDEQINLTKNFKELLVLLHSLLVQNGVRSKAYSDSRLVWFAQLNIHEKKIAITDLSVFVEICMAEMQVIGSLSNTNSFLWRGLKELGLKFSSDLFHYITDENVVEVYNLENRQVFRNLKFFDYVSYTLEEIYCRPWPDLFHRPEADKTLKVLACVKEVVTSGVPMHGCSEKIGMHIVEERDSPQKIQMSYLMDCIFPVYYNKDEPFGFVAIEKAEILNMVDPLIDTPAEKNIQQKLNLL